MSDDRHSPLSRFLFRTGHLFVENPGFLIAFTVRFFGSLRFIIIELSETPAGALRIAKRNGRQTARAFLRGIVPVLLAGFLLGYLIHDIASSLGGTVHVLFDSLLMTHILREILPLATALIVAGRAGSAIAGKFAVAPAMRMRQDAAQPNDRVVWSDRDIYTEAMPQVTATVVTAAIFYGVLVACVLAGYVPSDIRGASPGLKEAFLYASLPRFSSSIGGGAWRAALCGLFIGIVACGFGVRASEEFTSRTSQMFELHNAIWESIITSLTLCLGLIGSCLIATTP
jgi:ABC-type transporter Mla maintaining outer membrane lipid asymmetry permease subunit MlaE